MLSSSDHARYRKALRSPTLARAHEALIQFFAGAEYDLSPLPGAVTGVAVRDRDDCYRFAWHIAKKHLLVYIRRPALNVAPGLHALAVRHHGAERISTNAREETLIYLHSHEDAAALLDWLAPELPLPACARRGRRRRTS